jgi:hypothetical protein
MIGVNFSVFFLNLAVNSRFFKVAGHELKPTVMRYLLCQLSVVISFFAPVGTTVCHAQFITAISGGDTCMAAGDGGLAIYAFNRQPYAMCRDRSGNIYFSDNLTTAVRKINPITGIITAYAGGGSSVTDSIPATTAAISNVRGMCVDTAGDLLITNGGCHCVQKIHKSTGIITRIAGTGTSGFSGDGGLAIAAQLWSPWDVITDSANNIYIADHNNQRIRKIDAATGVITTIAGDGIPSFSGDGGPATNARLFYPTGVFCDNSNNIYIADYSNHCIREISAVTGIITTISGIGGSSGYSGDGGPATAGRMYWPCKIVADISGHLYISEGGNERIRRVDMATGIISTFAGNGLYYAIDTFGNNGPATAAPMQPLGMCMDSCNNLFFTDGGCAVRVVTASLPFEWCRHTTTVPVTATVKQQELNIWPNPSDGTFSVRVSSQAREPVVIIINDILGRKVKELTTETNKDVIMHIGTSLYTTGVYFINAIMPSAQWSEKVVINQ